MTQKAIKIGDSVGVVIPKKSLKALGIRPGDDISVEVDQQLKEVRVRSLSSVSKQEKKIAELTYSFIQRYRKDLEALADK